MSTTTLDQATKTVTVYGRTYTATGARARVAELTAQNKAWGASDDRCTELAFFAEQGITAQAATPPQRAAWRDLYQAPDGTGKTHYVGVTNEFACGADSRASRVAAARRLGVGFATCQRCQAIAEREDRQ